MNKEEKIIIDGVNVAGCSFFWGDTDTKCHMALNYSDSIECCEIHNCHYKQLKRLEQENSELKTHCKKIDEVNKNLYNEKIKLLEENARLKELEKDLDILQADYLLDDRDEDEFTIPLIIQIKNRLDLLEEIDEENAKYKSALDEIEKIIIQEKVTNNKKLRAILDIINLTKEVENEI